jgi:hypothetical protein
MCVEGSTMDKSSVSGGGQFRGGDGKINPVAGAAVSNGSNGRGGSNPAQFTGGAPAKREEKVWWVGVGLVIAVVGML